MTRRHLLAFALPVLLAACATGAGSGVKPYPDDTCLVTGNRLGSMGAPVTRVYGNQQVKFCCQPCVARFEKDPQRYLARLGRAEG